MVLVKKFTKIGNSWGVILPSEAFQALDLSPESECEIEIKKNVVQLRPHKKVSSKDEKVMKAMARFLKKYRDDLQRLA
ncbi:MAG: hypothetical protein JNK65_09630 [Deltaproteobacteria bacterium]|nr:hypothetical protein [Deltaproteobacteria bacterium]